MTPMPHKVIHSAQAPAAVGPYSQGIKTGNLFFFSGQIPIDPAVGKLIEGDITAQAEQACKNVMALLESQGLTADNVVKTTVFLQNKLKDQYFLKQIQHQDSKWDQLFHLFHFQLF